jgi:hypothetical protein
LPLAANKFVRRKPTQGLYAFGVVVGQQESLPVFVKFVCGLVVVTLNGNLKRLPSN